MSITKTFDRCILLSFLIVVLRSFLSSVHSVLSFFTPFSFLFYCSIMFFLFCSFSCVRSFFLSFFLPRIWFFLSHFTNFSSSLFHLKIFLIFNTPFSINCFFFLHPSRFLLRLLCYHFYLRNIMSYVVI